MPKTYQHVLQHLLHTIAESYHEIEFQNELLYSLYFEKGCESSHLAVRHAGTGSSDLETAANICRSGSLDHPRLNTDSAGEQVGYGGYSKYLIEKR